MKNLFKYAASYWKAMIAIVLILVVQAYCDLSLPAYTSDIVNVGIQQGGIKDEVPRQIATEEMEKLLLFVSEDDQQTVMDAYTEDNTSYKKEAYVLKDSVAEEENTMENLKDILQIPMMMTSGIESGSDTTKQMEDKLKEQMSQGMAQSMPQGADQTMPEGMPQGESQAVSLDDMSMFDLLKMLPAEQRATMVEKIEEQMSEMPDTILDQASVSFCRSAYKDLGMDMDQTQIHYLLKTGGQMAALALLGMVASIMVAFLASRVGASAGRDLRSGVFHKVVGFSNNEFNHFSTASLITRSTNDIQQIQMLIVMLLRMVLYAPILAIGGVLQVMKTNGICNATTISNDEQRLKRFYGCPYMLGLDIFPLDYVSKNKEEVTMQEEVYKIVAALIVLMKKEENTEEIELMFCNIEDICKIEIDRNRNILQQLYRLLDLICQMYGEKEAEELTLWSMILRDKKFRLKKEWYDKPIKMQFEQMQLYVPREYDKVLREMYGAWRKPVKFSASHIYPCYKKQEEILNSYLERGMKK